MCPVLLLVASSLQMHKGLDIVISDEASSTVIHVKGPVNARMCDVGCVFDKLGESPVGPLQQCCLQPWVGAEMSSMLSRLPFNPIEVQMLATFLLLGTHHHSIWMCYCSVPNTTLAPARALLPFRLS
jgi:hypothetical protein